jgi:tetratricopeptide (TPR) repeat protein
MTASRVPRRAAALLIALCVGLVAGCASYENRSMLIKQALVQQDYAAALQNVEKIGKSSSELLYLYEKGLILHYQDRYAQSNEVFEQAEDLLEDLYTKSVSREMAALVVKDDIAKYRGEPFEAVFVNYYKILNYLHLDDLEGALVECRRVNRKLQMINDAAGDDEVPFENDPFIQYLTAMVYDAAGDDNDAAVSYRVAVATYDSIGADAGLVPPWTLYCDAARNARRLGDFGESDDYAERAGRDCPDSGDGAGVVNLFLEGGYVTHRVEQSIALPIYEDDDRDDDEHLARRMAERRHHARRKVRVTQVIKIAMPALAEDPMPFAHAVVEARGDSSGIEGGEFQSVLVDDLNVHARRAFAAEEGKILLRTIVRTLAKTAAQTKLGEKNEAAGVLLNVFNVATETADTRSWTTLPQRILMSRLRLPEGTWDLDVTLLDGDGTTVHSFTITGVEARPDRPRFINYRIY